MNYKGKEITITYRVQNLESDQVMPYFIGGHPAFHCRLLADEDYEDYELIFEKKKAVVSLSCSQKLDWSIACSGRHFSIISVAYLCDMNYLKRCHYFRSVSL